MLWRETRRASLCSGVTLLDERLLKEFAEHLLQVNSKHRGAFRRRFELLRLMRDAFNQSRVFIYVNRRLVPPSKEGVAYPFSGRVFSTPKSSDH